MTDFEMVMKFPPNSIADVLRRLTGTVRTDPTNAPTLTLHLISGASVAGYFLHFRKDHSHQFVVTIGNVNVDGAVDAVSYIPLTQISALTVHSPGVVSGILEEVPVAEDNQP
jgi:hypothetical protein